MCLMYPYLRNYISGIIFVKNNIIPYNDIVKFYYKMNIKKIFITILQAGKPSFPAQKSPASLGNYSIRYLIFLLLIACSKGYKRIIQLRTALYKREIFRKETLPRPVMSVGNITTGGTGKTPTVIKIAQILRQHGKRTVILTRGYRRNASTPNYLLHADTDVHIAGDEPLLMMQKLRSPKPSNAQDVPIIVGSSRYLSGKLALEHFQPDIFLLDDGFQHMQLERTCDLVLIDATNPFGGDYLLPAGFLREPVENLARAHAFLITRSDEIDDTSEIEQQLRQFNPHVPIFKGIHALDEIQDTVTGETLTVGALQRKRLLVVSGLGNPASFHRLLTTQGLAIAKHLDFPDHHWYTEQDAHEIRHIAAEDHIDALVTTEKDKVKLLSYSSLLQIPCYVITIQLEIHPKETFEKFVLDVATSGE